jgi:hypothetical protein
VLSEATGRPRAEVVEILDLLPMRGLDRNYTPEDAERWLAGMRRELPQFATWLREGAARRRPRPV